MGDEVVPEMPESLMPYETRVSQPDSPGETNIKALLNNKDTDGLCAELANVLDSIDGDRVSLLCGYIDANLVFNMATHIDLRYIVFECLGSEERWRILKRIRSVCASTIWLARGHQGFIVLTDVDDTLLPGHDPLGVSGTDESWYTDGSLYPGVVELLTQLRGEFHDTHKDYPVLLTARPGWMVRGLVSKLNALLSDQTPRMAMLPGTGEPIQMAKNIVGILKSDFTDLGYMKLIRILQYHALFPDSVGRLVFIGDDGQADLNAAVAALQLSPNTAMQTLREVENAENDRAWWQSWWPWDCEDEEDLVQALIDGGAGKALRKPVVAFVAIKAVTRDGTCIGADERAAVAEEIRGNCPPVPIPIAAMPEAASGLHRFFYFDDYLNLAEQLSDAGWITVEQTMSVAGAFAALDG